MVWDNSVLWGFWAEFILVSVIVAYFTLVTTGILLARRFKKRPGGASQHLPVDSWRRRVHMWLYVRTSVGTYLDFMQGVCSAVSCGLYVWETYEEPSAPSTVVSSVELCLSVLFLLDYGLRFYMAKDRLRHVWSLMGIVDVITVLPVFVYVFLSDQTFSSPTYLRLIRLIKFLRVLRSLRIVRATVGFGLRRRIYTLFFSVISLIFVAAGGFHFLESRTRVDFSFHNALYYTTIETLGRPRIDAATDEGYVWLMAVVAISVVLIPKQLAELFSVAKAETVYKRENYHKKSMEHVVVMGHQDFGSVNCVLYEFFHKDRGYHSSDVVLFFEEAPTREVEMLLEHPAYVGAVQYVQGSPLVEDDLKRVSMSTAVAVVVLANKNPPDPFWEDCRITSSILSCKAFWRANPSNQPDNRLRVLAQVLKPETREQLLRTPGWKHDDVILVITELSSIMVGLNALHPGLTTLIFNLFSHVEEQPAAPEWYREYEHGAMQEIYRVVIGDSLECVEMTDAAAFLLLERNVVLLAMEVDHPSPNGSGKELVLFPGRKGVLLKSGDIIYCIAFNVFLAGAAPGSAGFTSMVAEACLLEAAERSKGRMSVASRRSRASTWTSVSASTNSNTYTRESVVWKRLRQSFSALKRASACRQSVKQWAVHNRASLCLDEFERLPSTLDYSGSPEALSPRRSRFVQVEGKAGQDSGSPRSLPTEEEPTEEDVEEAQACVSAIPDSRIPDSRIPPPFLSYPETAAGRQRVLSWLLSSGYGGNREAMRAELDVFLQASLPSSGEPGSLGPEVVSTPDDPSEVGPTPAFMSEGAETDAGSVMEMMEAEVFLRVPGNLCKHIVVFGVTAASVSALRDLARLILLQSDRSLVVLSPDARKLVDLATQEGWFQTLAAQSSRQRPSSAGPRRLYFVKGTPSSGSILERVRVHQASAAIFLPCVPSEGLSAEATERQHRMIDSVTVALTNFAAGEAAGRLWTVTQLLHGAAVKFFTDKSAWHSASADPRWLDIAPLNTHALFAAGQIVAGTMLDRLVIETYFNDKAIPLLGSLVFGDEAGSRLFEQPVPAFFHGKCYGELRRELLRRRQLPVGLLRGSNRSYSCIFRPSVAPERQKPMPSQRSKAEKKTTLRLGGGRSLLDLGREIKRTFVDKSSAAGLDSSTEARLPYVVTNPEPDLVLKDTDIVFALGNAGEDAGEDAHADGGDDHASRATEVSKSGGLSSQSVRPVTSSHLSMFMQRTLTL